MTKPRILVVTEDAAAASEIRRAAQREAEVVVCSETRSAQRELSGREPCVIAVVDSQVGGLSGLEILRDVRRVNPEVTAILLTREDDALSAADAVNRGRLFAIVPRPFGVSTLPGTIQQAFDRVNRHGREKALIAHAFMGIAQLLTGRAPAVAAEAPAYGERLRERSRTIGAAMKLTFTADMETAALIVQAAIAAVPRHVMEKLHEHQKLGEAETAMLERIGEAGARIVQDQPNMAGVADILQNLNQDPAQTETHESGIREKKVPLASRILCALVDLEILEGAGFSPTAALLQMRRDAGKYDSEVLKKLELHFGILDPKSDATLEECMVEDLVVGLVLATDAMSTEGVPLIAAGTELTNALIEHLRNFADLGEVVEPLYVARSAGVPPGDPDVEAQTSGGDN